jgi:hypothetical protein
MKRDRPMLIEKSQEFLLYRLIFVAHMTTFIE